MPRLPTDPPALDEARVWLARPSAIDVAEARRWLDEDERSAAERRIVPADAARFVVGRAMRRAILGACAGTDALRFIEGAWGKPELARDHAFGDLAFNVSHSGDLVALAVTRGRAVGVDVELVRPLDDLAGVAEISFSSRERAEVLAREGDARIRAFFACWTRKEAVIKAIGRGLHHPLASFDVSTDPDQRPALVASRDPALDPGAMTLLALDVPAPYAGAVAVEGPPVRVVVEAWSLPAIMTRR